MQKKLFSLKISLSKKPSPQILIVMSFPISHQKHENVESENKNILFYIYIENLY